MELCRLSGFLPGEILLLTHMIELQQHFLLECCYFTLPMALRPNAAHSLLILEFLDHINWCTTVDRNPLNEWSARSRDVYLTTHNTHDRQTSMPPAVLEPTIPGSERPQTHALDRAATGVGECYYITQLSKVHRLIYYDKLRIIKLSFSCCVVFVCLD
jgi:hypothetical protein